MKRYRELTRRVYRVFARPKKGDDMPASDQQDVQ